MESVSYMEVCPWCKGDQRGTPIQGIYGSCWRCNRLFYFSSEPKSPLYDVQLATALRERLCEREKIKGDKKYASEVLWPLLKESFDDARKLAMMPYSEEKKTRCKGEEGRRVISTLWVAMREIQRVDPQGQSAPTRQDIEQRQHFTTYQNLVSMIELVAHDLKHPELLEFDEKWLSTELVTASRIGDTGSEKERHEAKLKLFSKERPLVFTIPFFCQEFCSLFVEDFRQIQRTIEFAPLTYRGLFVDQLGFLPFMHKLVEFLNKVVRCFHSTVRLRFNQASVIHFDINTYSARPRDEEYFFNDKTDSRIGHPYHVDSGDVTANVCLGDIFEGGAVNFRVPPLWDSDNPPVSTPTQETGENLKAPSSRDRERDRTRPRERRRERKRGMRPRDEGARRSVSQKVGSAMLHPAQLLHSSDHLISGQRFNLILWMDAEFEFHYWSQLPPELQLHILSFIEVKNLRLMTRCNRSMRTLALSDTLWHNLYETIFNSPEIPDRVAPEDDDHHLPCRRPFGEDYDRLRKGGPRPRDEDYDRLQKGGPRQRDDDPLPPTGRARSRPRDDDDDRLQRRRPAEDDSRVQRRRPAEEDDDQLPRRRPFGEDDLPPRRRTFDDDDGCAGRPRPDPPVAKAAKKDPEDMEGVSWAEKFKAAILQNKREQVQADAAVRRARMSKAQREIPHSATADFARATLALVGRVHPPSACYVQ